MAKKFLSGLISLCKKAKKDVLMISLNEEDTRNGKEFFVYVSNGHWLVRMVKAMYDYNLAHEIGFSVDENHNGWRVTKSGIEEKRMPLYECYNNANKLDKTVARFLPIEYIIGTKKASLFKSGDDIVAVDSEYFHNLKDVWECKEILSTGIKSPLIIGNEYMDLSGIILPVNMGNNLKDTLNKIIN